jgi:diguanylate cyclase (GGDEF)-like protein
MRNPFLIKRRIARVIGQTSVMLGVAMIAMLWGGIYLKYRDQAARDHADAIRNTANVAILFEEHVQRAIGEAGKSLYYMLRAVEKRSSDDDFHRIVTNSEINSEIIVQFAIMDETGMMRASSAGPQPAKPIDLSDREHFLVHKNATKDELYVSSPVVGRASGKWSIQLTRRFHKPDGTFGGVVVASLNPDHFTRFYESFYQGNTASISLVGLDGRVRATAGAGGIGRFKLGQDISGTALLERMRAAVSGTFTEAGATADSARIVAFRRVLGLPLAVSVGMPESEVTASAMSDAARHALVGALLTAIILLVMFNGVRDELHLQLAKAKLLRSQKRALQKSEQLRLTLDSISQGIMLVTKDRRLPVINRQAIDLLDLPETYLHRAPSFDELVKHQENRGEFVNMPIAAGVTALEHLTQHSADGTYPIFERTRPNGTVLEVRTNPLPGGGFVRTFMDITHRRQAQEAVARLASEDALTGLGNRRFFREHLEKRSQQPRTGTPHADEQGFALLCLDLDWFKDVNDTLGHWIGDALLKSVAERLTSMLRAGNTIARLGGDEFAVLLPRTNSAQKTEVLAKRIIELLAQPYDIYGHSIQVGVSIGIALAPHDGNDPDLLLKAADMALYAAKAAGRGTYKFFHKSMAEQLRARRQLELDLRAAIENDELELHYQPLLNVEDQSITGFEALMRWRHPIRGMVFPGEFIPMAEETGLIAALGEWALHKACAQAATWPEHIYVAVNVSPMQFRNGDLVAIINQALHEAGLPPSRLELEITETILMQESESTLDTLHELRSSGVRISMDDFGTGYSSLSYLRSFPLSKIKIDRAFVKDLGTTSAGDVIIRSIIDIARTLEMTTTAEGVETALQFQSLQLLGCSEAQGYYLSKPVPASELPDLIETWSKKSLAA